MKYKYSRKEWFKKYHMVMPSLYTGGAYQDLFALAIKPICKKDNQNLDRFYTMNKPVEEEVNDENFCRACGGEGSFQTYTCQKCKGTGIDEFFTKPVRDDYKKVKYCANCLRETEDCKCVSKLTHIKQDKPAKEKECNHCKYTPNGVVKIDEDGKCIYCGKQLGLSKKQMEKFYTPTPSKRVEPIEKIEKANDDEVYLAVGEDYLGFVTITTLVDKINEAISHIIALEVRE